MPKAKITEGVSVLPSVRVCLACVVLLGLAETSSAEAVATLEQAVDRARQVKAQELSGRLSSLSVGTGAPAPSASRELPMVAPEPPVLKALYGIGEDLRAEILYDGKLHSIGVDDQTIAFGGWRFASVFSHGVLLTKSVTWKQKLGEKPDGGAPSGEGGAGVGSAAGLTCRKLRLPAGECLFMAVRRGVSDAAPILPRSGADDSQARYLSSQLPMEASTRFGRSGRPAVSPQLGTPGNAGNAGNAGNGDLSFPLQAGQAIVDMRRSRVAQP